MNYCASPSFAPGMVIERIKSLSNSEKVILFIGEIFLYWLWQRGIERPWLRPWLRCIKRPWLRPWLRCIKRPWLRPWQRGIKRPWLRPWQRGIKRPWLRPWQRGIKRPWLRPWLRPWHRPWHRGITKIIYQYPTIAVINNPSLWVTEHGITFPLTINILIITLCLTYGISMSSISLLCWSAERLPLKNNLNL